ncbi:hypothetical protein JCM8547_003581 [Rhodosporidiobolus lusitaniae]
MKAVAVLAALAPLAWGYTVVDPANLPHKSENGQLGYNDCSKYGDSATANCQTLWLNSIDDFCLYAPQNKGSTIGNTEREVVSWCTKAGHGTRLIPKGTITGAHFIKTPSYIQITGQLKGPNINIASGDEGGELDPHGADGNGNPIGAVVLSTVPGTLTQIKEWTMFIGDGEFCVRACFNKAGAAAKCEHIYDVMGCYWNLPGNYNSGSFDTCAADEVKYPMGQYPVVKNGKTSISTWYQGVKPTPSAQPAAKSSQCKSQATITAASYTTGRITTTTKATTTAKPTATSGSGSCSSCTNKVPANASRSCASGTCSFTCNTGYKLNTKKTACVCAKGYKKSADGKTCVKA